MSLVNRFFEKTGALIVIMLLFALSARLEYEFWLAGSKYTNFLSPEHVAWAIAISSNISKFLVWGRLVLFQINKEPTPIKFWVGAMVLVLHSALCGVFAVAQNFDRAGVKQLQEDRMGLARTEYNLMREQQKAIAGQERQVLISDHRRKRQDVIDEYAPQIARWEKELERQKTRFFPGTKQHIGNDYKYADSELKKLTLERSKRLNTLDEEHTQKLKDYNKHYEERMMAFTTKLTNQLASSSSERLLEEGSIALTDPIFAPFLNVVSETASTKLKPAWIILAASLLLNIILELITILMLAILLNPFNNRQVLQITYNKLTSQP